MTDKLTEENERALPDAGDGEEADAKALKRRLLTRVGIAAVLILALLGGLAVLDDLNAPPPKKPEVVAEAPTQSAGPAAGTESAAPAVQVPPLSEESPAQESAGQIAPPAAEEAPEPPAASVAATPEISAQPTLPGSAPLKAEVPESTGPGSRPLTKPANARLAMLKPSEAASATKPLPPARVEPAAELARAAPAPASRPLTQAAARGGYLLQLGVFTSTSHAEELRAKLELNGIPAQIEARVQVGPFASRAEAEQMRAKLKTLGMEEGMLVATRK